MGELKQIQISSLKYLIIASLNMFLTLKVHKVILSH